MLFYGDLLKRGEIPVKDLQLSKHGVHPAAATLNPLNQRLLVHPTLCPCQASPFPAALAPACFPKRSPREGDGLLKVTQQSQARALEPSLDRGENKQSGNESFFPLYLCALGRQFLAEVL